MLECDALCNDQLKSSSGLIAFLSSLVGPRKEDGAKNLTLRIDDIRICL